jgi:hypothetical protein
VLGLAEPPFAGHRTGVTEARPESRRSSDMSVVSTAGNVTGRFT